MASVQTCEIEKFVCRNHVFAEFFKQASVKASRFDANDKNCGIQHILQRGDNHKSISTALQNEKIFTFPEHLQTTSADVQNEKIFTFPEHLHL